MTLDQQLSAGFPRLTSSGPALRPAATETIAVSMTDFVDFVLRTGTPKFTVVKKAWTQNQTDYDPRTDFYKRLREGIAEAHEQGSSLDSLDNLAASVTNTTKKNIYPELIRAYKRFIGRKTIEWFSPPKAKWEHSNLAVRVNPEVGLTLNGKKHAIKLYLKEPQPKKRELATALHLMQLKITGVQVAILDVRRSKLHVAQDEIDPALTALLQGEALSFASIYEVLASGDAARPKPAARPRKARGFGLDM